MFDILNEEFQLGWLDATGLQQYIGWGQITQDQYNQITNTTASATSSATSATPQSATAQSSTSNTTSAQSSATNA